MAGAWSLEPGGYKHDERQGAFPKGWDSTLPKCLRPLTSAWVSYHPHLTSQSPRIGLTVPSESY